jgi:hypothetical protein
MKLNPFEQGLADFSNGLRNSNPFPTFSQRWALYNKGFNSRGWEKLNEPNNRFSEKPHGCGHMQGRGAA